MKFNCFLLTWFLCGGFLSQAQSFENALAGYRQGPQVFLHHDQEGYVPGETVWFKAYITENGKPIARNTNLFVRLVSPSGTILSDQLYQVRGSTAKGSIELPPDLSNGVYQIQVLTNDMVPIGRFRQFAIPVTRTSRFKTGEELKINFYAEGGALLPGIPNRVAFTAEENGRPLAVSGQVREKGGAATTKFQSFHKGLGSFEFIPVHGKNYEAEVEWRGAKKIFDLPPLSRSGVQIHVEDSKDGKSFLLTRVAASATENAVITLVAEINGIVVYEQEIAFEDYPSLKGGLITNQLPSGILHFTVFDKDRRILAERLSFVDNGEYRIPVEISSKNYSSDPRSSQVLEIKLTGETEFSGSIAIVQDEGPADETIISDLLLSSRLKRFIHEPAWFLQGNDSSRSALDILLQTQQLDAPNWDRVLRGTKSITQTIPDFISVWGRVMDKDEKQAMGPGRLNFYLVAEDSSTLNYEARVDEQGRFGLDSMDFSGRSKLYYAYTDINEKQPGIKIIDLKQNHPLPFNLPFSPVDLPLFKEGTSPDLVSRIGQVKNHIEQVKILERVTVNARKQRPIDLLEEKYTSGVFRMQAAKTIDNINEPSRDGSMSVVDYIRNRINEVELTGTGFVNRKTLSMGSATRWAVGLFLDEVMTNMAILRTIRVSEVALVKFFDVGWVGVGTGYPGGAIAVFTKKESDMTAPQPRKLDHVGIQGYSIPKNFLHIDYGQKDFRQAPNDHRHTLYWNPDFRLPAGNGSFKFTFYNNDLKQERKKLVIQGFNPEGKLLYAEKILE